MYTIHNIQHKIFQLKYTKIICVRMCMCVRVFVRARACVRVCIYKYNCWYIWSSIFSHFVLPTDSSSIELLLSIFMLIIGPTIQHQLLTSYSDIV